MRKFKFLMFAFVLAGAAFTSCSKDDLLDVPELDKPVVTINRDGASITTINDKNAGEIVPVVARFDMGAQQDQSTPSHFFSASGASVQSATNISDTYIIGHCCSGTRKKYRSDDKWAVSV